MVTIYAMVSGGIRSYSCAVLKVERNANDHRPPFPARLQKGIAKTNRHSFRHMQAVVSSTRGSQKRSLIYALIVPTGL